MSTHSSSSMPTRKRSTLVRATAAVAAVGVVMAGLLLTDAARATPSLTPANGTIAGGTSVNVEFTGHKFVQVSAGYTNTVALDESGQVWAWGHNTYGEVGNGTTGAEVLSPAKVTMPTLPAGSQIVQVASGAGQSFMLGSDGSVWGWGWNFYNGIGDGSSTHRSTPVPVTFTGMAAGHKVTSIVAGYLNSGAIASDGSVWMWGSGEFSPWAGGSARTTPQLLSITNACTLGTASELKLGRVTYSLLGSNGTMCTWGWNELGAMGSGSLSATVDTPTTLSLPDSRVTAELAMGQYHGVAVATDGTVWRWGTSVATTVLTPEQVTFSGLAGGEAFTSVEAGDFTTLMKTSAGKLWGWGLNSFGQLGTGTTASVANPIEITTPWDATVGSTMQLSLSPYHSAALASNGKLWLWGHNEGRLGLGTTPDSSVITQQPWLTTINAVKFGGVAGTSLTQTGYNTATVTTPVGTAGASALTVDVTEQGVALAAQQIGSFTFVVPNVPVQPTAPTTPVSTSALPPGIYIVAAEETLAPTEEAVEKSMAIEDSSGIAENAAVEEIRETEVSQNNTVWLIIGGVSILLVIVGGAMYISRLRKS